MIRCTSFKWSRRIVFIILCALLAPGFLLSATGLSVLHVHPDSLMIEVTFDKPDVDPNEPVLLQKHHQIFVTTHLGSDVHIRSVSEDWMRLSDGAFHTVAEDLPIGSDKPSVERVPGFKLTQSHYTVTQLFLQGDKRYWRVRFNRFKPDQKMRSDRWLKRATVHLSGQGIQKISDTEMSLVQQKMYSDRRPARSNTSAQAGSYSSDSDRISRLNIPISKEGLYVVTRNQMLEGGWRDFSADPRYFRITNRTGEIPIRISGEADGRFDAGDFIEFWGEPNWVYQDAQNYCLNPYDTLNVYRLEIANRPGLRMGSESGVPAEPSPQILSGPRSYMYTEHFERDGHFDRLPYELDLEEQSRWFYDSALIGGSKREYTFDTPGLDSYAIHLATLRVKVRGLSTNLLPQPVEVFINDRLVISQTNVHNQEMILESSGFSPTYLREENTLTVSNRSSEQELAKLFVDWYEITYPRMYETETDYLKFSPPRNSTNRQVRFEIAGFSNSNIKIYKLGAGRIQGFEVESVTDTLDNTTYTAIFMDEIFSESDEYIALTPESKSMPDTVMQVRTPDLRAEGLGADYIVITPHDSLGPDILQPLIDVRESQGLQCEIVCLDTIYDNFNHGMQSPEAIKSFLEHAYHHWTPAPRFCLLVGDGYYRHLENRGVENLVPVYHFQTWKFGAAASDHRFALVDGADDFADLAIGRLPVQDREQLAAIVDKIVTYETTPPSPWRNRYLLIGSGATDDVFRVQSENIIDQIIPHAISPERLYLSGSLLDPYVGGTEDLLRHMRDGVALVNFRGHGGGAIWADAGLLDLDDIELIDNAGRLPIMTSMTCFTADFASQRQSLGEALICEPDNGAIAFWGASGVGWVNADYYMVQELFKLFETNPDLTLGEMIRVAKRNFLIEYPGTISRSDVYQYNLLGDPALTVPFPSGKIVSELAERSIDPDGSIQVSGLIDFAPADIAIEIAGENGDDAMQQETQTSDGRLNLEIQPPSTLRTGGVRLYAWNESDGTHANAYLPFEIGGVYFDSLGTVPDEPAFGDTLYFVSGIADYHGIEEAWCSITVLSKDTSLSFPDSLKMTSTSEPDLYRTIQGLTGFQAGDFISYEIGIRNTEGETYFSESQSINVLTLPDFAPKNLRMGGADRVLLLADIRNNGTQPADQVKILFTDQTSDWTQTVIKDIPGGETIIADVEWSEDHTMMNLVVQVNDDSTIQESNYGNNQINSRFQADHFLITPENGSNGWIGFPGELQIRMPEQAVYQNVVLALDRVASNQLPEFNSFRSFHPTGYHLHFSDSSSVQEVQKSYTLRWITAPEDSTENLHPYYWSEKQKQWIFLANDVMDSLHLFQHDQLSMIGFMEKQDDQAPNIEIHVDNQPFVDMAYVPKNPKFSILIYDESGVDKRMQNLQILLDQKLLDSNQLMLSDSTVADVKRMQVQFQPQLESGNHRIEIQACDINGNIGMIDPMDFQVSSRFQAVFLGNYPNPFAHETVFAYALTDMAVRATLKIYTVSGRLIRVFDSPSMTGPDYHEILWDGNDEWGEEVANGVYFFRFKAQGSDRNDEVTGKIAKIR